MANRNLGYDIDVDYSGQSAAKSASRDLDEFGDKADRATREVEEFNRETGDTGRINKARGAWADFGGAMTTVSMGLAAAGAAAKQAYELMSRGADLDRVSGQAEALAADIGTSWKSLLADMTEATGGMITQADLTASAVDIIGLGMAGTGNEVVRLSRLVGELGWDMQTLTLTLANQSKARLDSLGLSVGDVTKRVEKFKDAGVEAEQAFKLAVLEAGEERLELLGSAADTAAGDLKKLEATWGDLMDRIAKGASESSAPLATYLLAELELGAAIEKGTIAEKQYARAQAEAIFTNKTLAEAYRELIVEIEGIEATEGRTEQYYRTINEQRLEAIEIIKAEEAAMKSARGAERRAESQEVQAKQITDYIARQREIGEDIVAGYVAAGDAVSAVATHQELAAEAAGMWAEQIAEIQALAGDAFTTAAFDPEQAYEAAIDMV